MFIFKDIINILLICDGNIIINFFSLGSKILFFFDFHVLTPMLNFFNK